MWGDFGSRDWEGRSLTSVGSNLPSRWTSLDEEDSHLSRRSSSWCSREGRKGGMRCSVPAKSRQSHRPRPSLFSFLDRKLTLLFHFGLLTVCATDLACGVAYNASGYTPQTSSSLLSAGQVANQSMVCNSSPRVYTAGQMICDVVVSTLISTETSWVILEYVLIDRFPFVNSRLHSSKLSSLNPRGSPSPGPSIPVSVLSLESLRLGRTRRCTLSSSTMVSQLSSDASQNFAFFRPLLPHRSPLHVPPLSISN